MSNEIVWASSCYKSFKAVLSSLAAASNNFQVIIMRNSTPILIALYCTILCAVFAYSWDYDERK